MTNTEVRYPEVKVQLVGLDGNAFSILGRVSKALRQAGVSSDEIKEFTDEATAGDYGHLLRTVMSWVSEDDESYDDDEDYEFDCSEYNWDF